MEQILEQIKNKLDVLDQRSERIENKLSNCHEELKKLTLENAELREENIKLKEQVMEQDDRLDLLEKETRKKKIVIQGIQDSQEECDLELKEKIRTVLRKIEVQINIENETQEVIRLGRYGNGRTRPVLIELNTWNKKWEIMKSAKKLRDFKDLKIWITEDYSKKVREQRKTLLDHMKKARANGQKAVISYNKLIVNGDSYTTEQIKDETAKKKGRLASQRSPQTDNEERVQQVRKLDSRKTDTSFSKN